MFTGILIFLFKLGSRRQMDYFFNSPDFISHIEFLSGQKLERAPDNDTIAYICERLDPAQLISARLHIIQSILRSRALEYCRLLNTYWLIAIDATGRVSYHERHCSHCLTATRNGKTTFYHNTLEAKLVSPDGFALSIATEFIENESPDVKKQDCELRGFYRMAPLLKKDFPQLPICLLADSLYSAGPFFKIAKKYGWHLIVSFKDGSIPSLCDEFIKLKKLSPENSFRRQDVKISQIFSWANDLDYANMKLSIIECVETNKKTRKSTRFVWITDLEVSHANYLAIAKGGRSRWKIENEGFNTQKNGGYALEHAFCSDNNGAKNFYLLLQIAHIINQLLEKGSLLRHLIRHTFGSIRNIARFMLEAFRTYSINSENIESELTIPFQIRFDSS
jgi:hypothetical protein